MSKNKILAIYGPRQVGKTTLLRQIMKELDLKSVWVNGDLSNYREYLSSRDLSKLKELIGDAEVLLIDEAQNIPDIGINLKIIYDEIPDIKIIITGSSMIDLANQTKETLAGRMITYYLYPLSITELLQKSTKIELRTSLNQILTYGAYPEIMNLESNEDKKEYLISLVSSYLYKDVLALSNIRNSDQIYKLLQLLALQIGSLVSVHELSKALRLNHETVNNYIDLLEQGFILKRLSGFSKNPKKEISKMDKIYFTDLGVRNALIQNFSSIDIRNDKGDLWENFLVMERMKHIDYNRLGGNLYFWRRYSGAELDLVEDRNGQFHISEFKWSMKKRKLPKSWVDAYGDAEFRVIAHENVFDIVT